MKLNILPALFLCCSLALTFSIQSCTADSITSDNNIEDGKEIVNEKSPESKTEDKEHGELSPQEHSDFVAKHAEHLSFVMNKMAEIKNEHIKKKDHFQFECGTGNATLERHYNDNEEIHLLSYTKSEDSTSTSSKHHFYWDNKLIYEFYHHVVEEGSKYLVDDHKTYFKDGKMVKCLERKYSYQKTESEPSNTPYKLVNLDPNKSTKDIEKLLTLSETEIKGYLCK